MLAAFLKALFVVAMPVVLFAVFGYWMMNATGRDQFPQTRARESVPLNFRYKGYDAEKARAYWEWLGPHGRAAEQRFLKADMLFPFLYGGAMLASLLLAWAALGRPMHPAWLIAPIGLMVAADWVENVVHWRELGRFMQGEPIHASWIQLASVATSAKVALFVVASALIVVLAGSIVVRASAD